MPAAVVDRVLGRGKAGVGEGSHGHGHPGAFMTLFRVEHGSAADRAEAESEFAALIANADVLGRSAGDLIGSGEASQRGKDTARSSLARKAVAHADAARLTL